MNLNSIIVLTAVMFITSMVEPAAANPTDDNMERSCFQSVLTHKPTICTDEARDCGKAMQGIPNDRACYSKAWLACYALFRRQGKPIDSDDWQVCIDKTMNRLTKEHPGVPVE
jgi:hypothetical protein